SHGPRDHRGLCDRRGRLDPVLSPRDRSPPAANPLVGGAPDVPLLLAPHGQSDAELPRYEHGPAHRECPSPGGQPDYLPGRERLENPRPLASRGGRYPAVSVPRRVAPPRGVRTNPARNVAGVT